MATQPRPAACMRPEAVPGTTLDPEGLAQYAEALLAKDQWAEGLAVADELLSREPGNEFAHRLRFVALMNLDPNADAIGAASEAIRLAPTTANGWYLRAKARWLVYQDQGALEDAARAVELDPDVPLYQMLLGIVLVPTESESR